MIFKGIYFLIYVVSLMIDDVGNTVFFFSSPFIRTQIETSVLRADLFGFEKVHNI